VRAHVILTMLMVGTVCARAQEQRPGDPQQAIDIAAVARMVQGVAGPEAEEPPAFPDFAKVTKGMVSQKGLFTLWYYPPDAKDKNLETLYCEIPARFLGEKFMLSTSFAGGGFLTGFPLEERVVQWELLDRQLLLVEPETRFVVDQSKEVADVVRRTYPDRIRVAVPILTKTPAGDLLIDLGRLLKSNFADIAWTSFLGEDGFGGPGAINPNLSKWVTRKTFPLNVEITVELAVGRPSPPGSYDKKLVHYSFWKLPQTDYKPRVADDRVGYFLTVNRDWSKPTEARDIFNRYIDRWHLVKRDPSLKMCEPREPITFYIEKTVPVKFRRAVRDGILEWNKAFEKIGFVNAIEVRQQTDDNEWKDLDPEDMRYSFFRWIVTGAGFAMGPHRANPFTGQIYDADIIFDDSMVRFFEREAQQFLPSPASWRRFEDPALQRFLEHFPQFGRSPRPWEGLSLRNKEEEELLERAHARLHAHGRPTCTYAHGMMHQMALGMATLAGQPPEVIDRFLYDCIKEVVTHEVGHTLGLRHNFKASSIYSLEEIQRRRTTGEPTCGSVMDYNPALLFLKNATEGHFITPTLGPYDYWAIEYGYRPFDGDYKPRGETPTTPPKEPSEPESSGVQAATPTTPPVEATTTVQIDLSAIMSQLPPELMAQMPEELKSALASGNVQSILTAAQKMSSAAPPPPTRPSAPTPVATPVAGEEAMLRDIASRAHEPELAYATDEDTTFLSPDPRTNRFDMGSDPVEWARARIELVNKRLEDILDWAVKDQESWYHLRSTFLTLMTEKVSVLDYVARYVGGQYFHRSHRGDPNAPPPFVPVEAERQRAALKFVEDTLYDDAFFAVSPKLLNHLAPSRWSHDGASISYVMDFPIHEYIAMAQANALFNWLYPNTLRRIQDNELKTEEPNRLTISEYVRRVQDSVWASATDLQRAKSQTWDDQRPFLSSVRRSLQREYLGLVEPLVRLGPGALLSADLHAMLMFALQKLSQDLGNVLSNAKLDFASQAHLTTCKSRIDRMLSAELKEYDVITLRGSALMQPTEKKP